MGHYEQEKSIGLKPIVITVGLIASLGFGALYYFYGKTTPSFSEVERPAQSSALSAPQPQPGHV